MKGDKTLFILKKIAEGVDDYTDLLFACLQAGYGASPRKIEYEAERIRTRSQKAKEERAERQRFYSLMYKLRKEGLMKDASKKPLLTSLGRMKLRQLIRFSEKQKNDPSASLRREYKKEKSTVLVLIMFDIPEKLRRIRDRLRYVLKELGFNQIQKSVFAGKVKIPPELLKDLKDANLDQYIEVVGISKTGTMVRHF